MNNSERLLNSQEKIDKLFELFEKPENKLMRDAWYALWDDRQWLIRDWGRLYKQIKEYEQIKAP